MLQYLKFLFEKYAYGRPEGYTFDEFKAEQYNQPTKLGWQPSILYYRCSCGCEWSAAAVFTREEQNTPLVQDGGDAFCPTCRDKAIPQRWLPRGSMNLVTPQPGEPTVTKKVELVRTVILRQKPVAV